MVHNTWHFALRHLEQTIENAKHAIESDSQDTTVALTAMLRAYQLLVESEERCKLFIEQSSDGIFRFDLLGPVNVADSTDQQVASIYQFSHLVWCNVATARMYGYDRPDLVIGKPLRELMPPDIQLNRDHLRFVIENRYRSIDHPAMRADQSGQVRRTLNSVLGRIENGLLVSVWGNFRRDWSAEATAADAASALSAQLTRLAIVASDERVPPDLAGQLTQIRSQLDRLLRMTAAASDEATR